MEERESAVDIREAVNRINELATEGQRLLQTLSGISERSQGDQQTNETTREAAPPSVLSSRTSSIGESMRRLFPTFQRGAGSNQSRRYVTQKIITACCRPRGGSY